MLSANKKQKRNKIKKNIIQLLGSQKECSGEEFFKNMRKRKIGEDETKIVMWEMIREGELELTCDRHLRLPRRNNYEARMEQVEKEIMNILNSTNGCKPTLLHEILHKIRQVDYGDAKHCIVEMMHRGTIELTSDRFLKIK
ncbi:MAG: hypothetical protein Q8Q06_00730 [bacterium]|nr:hypothetical protein [bacterium]